MTISKPKLLDLFCGAGGCTKGYQRAGFWVVGVDAKPQPHYCGDEFYQADAMSFPLQGFDVIHASPPCQRYSIATNPKTRDLYPDLLAAVRTRLIKNGKPWVIENVPGSPMKADVKICGCMVGLRKIRRVRLFETFPHLFIMMPPCGHDELAIPVCGHGTPSRSRRALGRNVHVAEKREIMGIDWMNRDELSQAIPPAYTELIGREIIKTLGEENSQSEPPFVPGRRRK